MDQDTVNEMPSLIGRRIRQARIAAGLTQDEVVLGLAENEIILTKAGLSKYERGGSVPKAKTLMGLSRVLGVGSSFFFEDREVNVQWLAFRKAAKLSKSSQEKVKVIAADYVDTFMSLRRAMEPHRKVDPVPQTQVRKLEDIETAAMKLRDYWKLGMQPIESVTGAIEDGGGIVIDVDGENDLFDGLSGWADETTPVVVVSREVSDDRRRFSLAHELGHLVMQIHAKIDKKTEECWAHRFAASFLVPAEVARRELGDKRRRLDFQELEILKQKHGLSMQAWIFRASDLGIIEQSHARTLYSEMGSRGWRRVEPVDFEGEEIPTKFRQLTVRALAEGILSRTQAERLCPSILRETADHLGPPISAMDARTLHKLPKAERERLMEEAAALVASDYESGGLLAGFDADGEEDCLDDSF
ncbi:MAG: ImmA/IrrE family metallo-endopeptidase [Phycisphaerales bacterium]|nr:ImmA/IrrE family metallo-endopeptidase [Phycisphaerales bacterium]